MTDQHQLSIVAAEFRQHFDQYYLGVIPRLLNEEGLFLSFVSMLTAIETLAGTYAPKLGSGERFRNFVSEYFPEIYRPFVDQPVGRNSAAIPPNVKFNHAAQYAIKPLLRPAALAAFQPFADVLPHCLKLAIVDNTPVR